VLLQRIIATRCCEAAEPADQSIKSCAKRLRSVCKNPSPAQQVLPGGSQLQASEGATTGEQPVEADGQTCRPPGC